MPRTRNLLLLSGEHTTIPRSEALAVLEAEGVGFQTVSSHDQLLLIDAEAGIGDAIARRAAFTMEGGRFLFSSGPSLDSLKKECSRLDWGFLGGRSFGVKVTRVRDYFRGMDTQRAQGEMGYSIKRRSDSAVNLNNPDVWVRGVISEGGLYAYLLEFKTDRKGFSARKPRTRPFFHPGVLEPRIARAFVNFSRVRSGEVFLDPFCGTGGFLIEAALLGCREVGMDLDNRMVNGARLNLEHYGLKGELLQGDAKRLPLDRADSIASDPPYGRGTSTMGENVRGILDGFFREAHSLLGEGRFLCTAAPVEINPSAIASRAGWVVREEHKMRVHKSLTRSIIVAERREGKGRGQDR